MKQPLSLRECLAKESAVFDLDQAAFILSAGRRPEELRYTTPLQLGLPLGEVVRVDVEKGVLETPMFGLVGPMGVLPRHHTAHAATEHRNRNPAVASFLEMLARRFPGMWVRAGWKHRIHRDPERIGIALDALVGLGTEELSQRLPVPREVPRYHVGHLASRTQSASRLAAMLSEEAGAPVQLEEFAGGWTRIPERECTRLGQRHSHLGVDAAAGCQVFDPQARFIVRVGPVGLEAFDAMLPGTPLFARLSALTMLFVSPEHEFLINPVLRAEAVPGAQLGTAQLGLTAWCRLQPGAARSMDASDAKMPPPRA